MSGFRTAARSTLIAGTWAVLFVAFMFGMRYLNSLENKNVNFASWHLRGMSQAE